MIRIFNHSESQESQNEELLQGGLSSGSVPEGYLPDENDPAWPSRSGQGD
ncbi:MAG: hypothetical protein ACOY94_01580 [Bacillota bacterium]